MVSWVKRPTTIPIKGQQGARLPNTQEKNRLMDKRARTLNSLFSTYKLKKRKCVLVRAPCLGGGKTRI